MYCGIIQQVTCRKQTATGLETQTRTRGLCVVPGIHSKSSSAIVWASSSSAGIAVSRAPITSQCSFCQAQPKSRSGVRPVAADQHIIIQTCSSRFNQVTSLRSPSHQDGQAMAADPEGVRRYNRNTPMNLWDACLDPGNGLASGTTHQTSSNAHLESCQIRDTIAINAQRAVSSLTVACLPSRSPQQGHLQPLSAQLSNAGICARINQRILHCAEDGVDQKGWAPIRSRPWPSHVQKYVEARDTDADELQASYERMKSAKANVILQDQLTQVAYTLFGIPAKAGASQYGNDVDILVSASVHVSGANENSISDLASATAREATTLNDEQNSGNHQLEQCYAAMPESFNILPRDTALFELQEASQHTARILPIVIATPLNLGFEKSASGNGCVSGSANQSAGSGIGGTPQLLHRALVAWPRSCSSPNAGDDGHPPQPYAALARARHCVSVAQSTCGSSLAISTSASCNGSVVGFDGYQALKEDRDDLVGKLLATNEQLAKEQLLRRAAESDVASQRQLVDQLVSAQEGLQPTPDLDAVPLGTLCSAVGRRLLSAVKDRSTHAAGTFFAVAAKAKDVVKCFMR